MKDRINVMLVDDETAVRNILKMIIPWEDYNMQIVGEASSGIQAINMMENLEPDLILVDIRMPFMDGLEFSRIVLESNPEIVIVILTAYEDFSYAQEALRAKVTDFLLKPVEPEELSARMKELQKIIYRRREEKEKQIIFNIENPDKIVSQVKTFILDHYDDPKLNVAYVAKEFGFDRSYLSRMYKKETGELLIDFLIKCRIKIAKKLARNGQKMYITANQVGIPDANYFGKCFKKYVGMSYKEYQKNNENSVRTEGE